MFIRSVDVIYLNTAISSENAIFLKKGAES